MIATRTLTVGLIAIGLLSGAAAARAADTEASELPDGIVAKMARLNSKMGVDRGGPSSNALDDSSPAGRARAGASGPAGAGANPACGSLNVGNVTTGGRIGAAPREVNVIIKGDVINANNKCR